MKKLCASSSVKSTQSTVSATHSSESLEILDKLRQLVEPAHSVLLSWTCYFGCASCVINPELKFDSVRFVNWLNRLPRKNRLKRMIRSKPNITTLLLFLCKNFPDYSCWILACLLLQPLIQFGHPTPADIIELLSSQLKLPKNSINSTHTCLHNYFTYVLGIKTL